ncbi:hypothetical protein JPH1_52630 (plasmid) [Mycobacterium avium subsp. hominissuis]|uniref:Uncharacterized protein n=1 Tax=Mycobacterium avium subsp. hominissuis TaxID=439334 RepID=A0AAI8ST32_MYCAV|nr:hypothetical protein JPH1_52630 [Mycobacterium avium subsp. hominissuis]
MKLPPAPRRLQPVRELGPYEINVGALSTRHVGLTIAVRRGRNTVTGPLRYKPAASIIKPLLVCRLGDFDVALHPAAAVLVVPEDYKVTMTIAPAEKT